MYVYCVRKLGLDPENVNVNGGGIALGHPLDKLLSAIIFSGFQIDNGVAPFTSDRCATDCNGTE